uniref:Uncharacterized protein n=1 Tax=Glossina pallidipes TaxID=7398 RepID=A0A1A9ZF82_GLOPL
MTYDPYECIEMRCHNFSNCAFCLPRLLPLFHYIVEMMDTLDGIAFKKHNKSDRQVLMSRRQVSRTLHIDVLDNIDVFYNNAYPNCIAELLQFGSLHIDDDNDDDDAAAAAATMDGVDENVSLCGNAKAKAEAEPDEEEEEEEDDGDDVDNLRNILNI